MAFVPKSDASCLNLQSALSLNQFFYFCMYLQVYLIKVLFLSSLSYHHIILFCRPELPGQYKISKLFLWLNICLGIISYYHTTLMLTRKISKTTSLTYYYLFYFEFWCINWRYENEIFSYLVFLFLIYNLIYHADLPWFKSST